VVDVDDGNNAAIKYTMKPVSDAAVSDDYYNPLDWTPTFIMDANNGVVSVASAVDRLVGRILSFQINATDRNGVGLSASSALELSVIQKK
jgi:hypothetical protein